jgi:hypothetical protein
MKHKYGYMEVPGAGFFSVPPDLYTSRDRNIIKLFNEAVTRETLSIALMMTELTISGRLPSSLAQCRGRFVLVSLDVGCSKTPIIKVVA